MNTQQKITIKILYGGDIRRLCVDLKTLNFASLVEKVKTLFSIQEVTSLKYLDDEEDFITFASDEELKEAVKNSTNDKKILRIYLNYEGKKRKCLKKEMSDSSSDDEKYWMRKLWMRKLKKWAEKDHRSCNKGECRMRKERLGLIDGDVHSFPKDIHHLFIDANFMFCALRSLGAKKGNRAQVDATLAKAWRQFHTLMKFSSTTLIFDDTKLVEEKEEPFRILCAKSTFNTSKDALLQFANEGRDVSEWLFVTPDRELTEKLSNKGAKVIRPKRLLRFACSVINEKETQVVDWLKSLQDVSESSEAKKQPKLERKEKLKKDDSSEDLSTSSDSSSDDEELKKKIKRMQKRLIKKQERVKEKKEKVMKKLQGCEDGKKKEKLLKKSKRLTMKEAKVEKKLKKIPKME